MNTIDELSKRRTILHLTQAYKKKDWDTFFILVDGHRKQGVFGLVCDELPPLMYWETLGWILQGESFYNEELIRFITNEEKDLSMRYLMMSKDDRKGFKKLPNTLTVYRGQGIDADGLGWSWTLSRDMAVYFANRFPEGEVMQGECKKSDVIAYFTGRNEDEIVVPREKVLHVKSIEKTESKRIPKDSMFFKNLLPINGPNVEEIEAGLKEARRNRGKADTMTRDIKMLDILIDEAWKQTS